jgi:hypothetical protein
LCAFAKIWSKFPEQNVTGFEGCFGRCNFTLFSSANERGKALGKVFKPDVWSVAVVDWLI